MVKWPENIMPHSMTTASSKAGIIQLNGKNLLAGRCGINFFFRGPFYVGGLIEIYIDGLFVLKWTIVLLSLKVGDCEYEVFDISVCGIVEPGSVDNWSEIRKKMSFQDLNDSRIFEFFNNTIAYNNSFCKLIFYALD